MAVVDLLLDFVLSRSSWGNRTSFRIVQLAMKGSNILLFGKLCDSRRLFPSTAVNDDYSAEASANNRRRRCLSIETRRRSESRLLFEKMS